VAQLRLTRADCQRAASATPSANGSVVRSTMPKIKDNMVYGPQVNASSWHKTDMSLQSPHVGCWGTNGRRSEID